MKIVAPLRIHSEPSYSARKNHGVSLRSLSAIRKIPGRFRRQAFYFGEEI